MFHILCTLENASHEISGVAFQDHDEGVITVNPVEADLAEMFGSIPGYKVLNEDFSVAGEEAAVAEAAEKRGRGRPKKDAAAAAAAAQAASDAAAAATAALDAANTPPASSESSATDAAAPDAPKGEPAADATA